METTNYTNLCKFYNLVIDENYDLIDPISGQWVAQGIQGAEAMAMSWEPGTEAWPAGETEFAGEPLEVAR